MWRGVRAWSRRVLEKASEKVLDVQGVDDGDDSTDDEDEGDTPEARHDDSREDHYENEPKQSDFNGQEQTIIEER